ncbi:hypothetical protein V6N13_014774 [Hibiscus sabdariffa]
MRTFVTNAMFGFLFVIAAAIRFSCCDANSNVLCIESEREALLKLKNDLIDHSNRISSWVETGDCCKWIGVFCDNVTGHVTQLHLVAPPFSASDDSAPIAEWEAYERSIQIPDFFGLLGSLTYLNLSQSHVWGPIPEKLGNLSKLRYLDLGHNRFDNVRSLQWVSRLTSLQYLDLSYVPLDKATDWVQVTFNLPYLLELHFSGCKLENDTSPTSTVNSTKSLVVLDLSFNQFSSVPTLIFSLHGLVSVDLSFNSLQCPIQDYFGNMSFLEVVDLSLNSLNSSIPNSLYSLTHLQSLRLGDNYFQGEISSAIGNLSSLIYLDLLANTLEGTLPTSLEHLCNLKVMDLSHNRISGPIPLSIGSYHL